MKRLNVMVFLGAVMMLMTSCGYHKAIARDYGTTSLTVDQSGKVNIAVLDEEGKPIPPVKGEIEDLKGKNIFSVETITIVRTNHPCTVTLSGGVVWKFPHGDVNHCK